MIEALMNLELPIVETFQKMANPLLDFLSQVISLFGEPYLAIPILVFLYWCVDKKKGFLLATAVIAANHVMDVLKLLVRAPRPFVYAPEVIVNKRASTATGYAFPSGHSTSSTTLFGTLARFEEKKWLKAILLSIPVCVALSRLYLGAHWPLDVICGILLGLSFVFFGFDWFSRMYDDSKRLVLILNIGTCIFLLAGIISVVLLQFFHGDIFIWKDYMEGSAMSLGCCMGVVLERRHVHFSHPRTWKNKILVYAVGLVLGLGIWFGLKSIPVLPYVFKFLAYFFLVFFVTYLYPFIGVKMGFFEQKHQ